MACLCIPSSLLRVLVLIQVPYLLFLIQYFSYFICLFHKGFKPLFIFFRYHLFKEIHFFNIVIYHFDDKSGIFKKNGCPGVSIAFARRTVLSKPPPARVRYILFFPLLIQNAQSERKRGNMRNMRNICNMNIMVA